MKKKSEIKLFEEKRVRTLWDAEKEIWYISVIDVIEVLTGRELSDKIGQLKMHAPDGKM